MPEEEIAVTGATRGHHAAPTDGPRPRSTAALLVRGTLTSCGALFLVALTFLCSAGLDLPYVVRVLVHRNASTTDHLWKATVRISAADRPSPWPRSPDCATTRKAFGTAGVASMEDYLTDGGAQSLVVIREGSLICEWYGNGGTAHTPAAAFSISKSVLALLVARAALDRVPLDLDQPITRHVPELRQQDRRFERITLRDLLDMRSGIAFTEEVHFPWVNQDQAEIYYASDIASTSIAQSRITSPPGPFTYNDFAPNLVGLALARASGEPLPDHMQELWDDLGAQDPAAWCVDEHGFAWHESGLVATARDLARVGQLFLTGGIVAGRRVAPQNYLRRALDKRPVAVVADFGGVQMGYQNGWWSLPRPDGTHDIVAMGNLGQVMLVSPANGTVVIRMGTDHVTESNAAIAARLQRVADSLGPIARSRPSDRVIGLEWRERLFHGAEGPPARRRQRMSSAAAGAVSRPPLPGSTNHLGTGPPPPNFPPSARPRPQGIR